MLVLDSIVPSWLGGESCGCMKILHQFWLYFQLVHIEDSFFWWGVHWKELAGGLFDKYHVGVVVADNGDEWDSVEAVGFTPAAYDCRLQDSDNGVVLVIDVDLVAGEYCRVSCLRKYGCAD